jgi:hypothetical protein
MTMDPKRLNPELHDWLQRRQQNLKIVKTTKTPSGQSLDWIPIESQDRRGKIASPPAKAFLPSHRADATRPLQLARFELDDPSIERGPSGTVPIVRPDFSRLTRTVALKDYLNKRGGAQVNRRRRNRRPTDPDPAGYFHNTDSQSGTFYGWDGLFSVWTPAINSPAGSGDDHSILQVWLQNYDKPQLQSIEGGWTVDQNLNGDALPHIFTYYTTNGYTSDGDNKGGYNTQVGGFVQYSSPSTTGAVVFPGILVQPSSTWGGAQYGVTMKFQLYQEPTNGEYNWWVAVNGIWMGYYPATLFAGGIGNSVEWIGSGGEVYSSLSNPATTDDQMGSGWQAQAGWTKAAFLSNLRNQTDLNGTMVDNDGAGTSDTATGSGTDPYTIQMFMESGSTWGSYFYVGGPQQLASTNATYDQISFDIVTGGDDLRGDSSATATVGLPGGAQTFTLKAQSDPGWGNNSDNVRTFTISGPAQPASAFGPVTITLTSHNGIFETNDNWNVQSVRVTLTGASGSTQLYDDSGNPFARLTGDQPSVTL